MSWTPETRTDTTLFRGQKIPAIVHSYADGSECTISEDEYDPAFDQDRPSHRVSEVLYMCSPDNLLHVIATERSRCSYVLEVYVKDVCNIQGMASSQNSKPSAQDAGASKTEHDEL